MRNKAKFLMAMVCTAVLITCSSCANANRNCSLINFATEQVAATGQELKETVVEQVDNSLKSIVITTISWNGNALSFLSESAEIEGRRVVFYGFIGQMDAEEPAIDWALPMGANCPITVYLPMGADCCVCVDEECILFPREVE